MKGKEGWEGAASTAKADWRAQKASLRWDLAVIADAGVEAGSDDRRAADRSA